MAGENAVIHLLLNWKPIRNKRKGRPRWKWLEEVMEDLRGTGVNNWQEKSKSRKLWNAISQKI